MATQIDYPLLTAEEFLEIDFGEHRAELDNGVIRMMAEASRRHSRVQTNIVAWLRFSLRGTGCAPHASDMATQTKVRSVRYPDVSVFCGHEAADEDAEFVANDPRVLVEILSAGTSRTDLLVKLPEYKALPSVDTVLFVDIAIERVRVVQRTGPTSWNEIEHEEPADIPLLSLGLVLPHDEIFARD